MCDGKSPLVSAPCLTSPSMSIPWQGHAAPILYAVWAEAGFLPEAELLNLRKISSDLDGHPVPVSAPLGAAQAPPPLPVSQDVLEGAAGVPFEKPRVLMVEKGIEVSKEEVGVWGARSLHPKLVLKGKPFEAPAQDAESAADTASPQPPNTQLPFPAGPPWP